MIVDLSKLILLTTYNSFKNTNVYKGSLALPASIPPATPSNPFSQTTTSFTLIDIPVFTKFYAYFNEVVDGIYNHNNPQWYNASIANNSNIAYPVVTDPTYGIIECAIFPVINGTTVTITAQGQNTTAHTFTASITVPFVFIDYTLAN